jgi:NDP-sugar pyrophosphorylase family protein
MANKVRKAVFPAAGLGTRFLPATKASPKEMLPLVDKPLIQYSVEEAVASGCESILIITGRDKAAIENHFDISYELEQLLHSGRELAHRVGFLVSGPPIRHAWPAVTFARTPLEAGLFLSLAPMDGVTDWVHRELASEVGGVAGRATGC